MSDCDLVISQRVKVLLQAGAVIDARRVADALKADYARPSGPIWMRLRGGVAVREPVRFLSWPSLMFSAWLFWRNSLTW